MLVGGNSGLDNRPSAEFFPSFFLWISFALFRREKRGPSIILRGHCLKLRLKLPASFEAPCLPDKKTR